jgi:Aspartyl protease/PDZ domain
MKRLAALVCCALLGGCAMLRREPPRPGSTSFGSSRVVLPANVLDNYIILTAKWDKYGPYRFLIDTGSTATLVTPELAQRYGIQDALVPEMPRVSVRSADGQIARLPSAVLGRIELGDVRFSTVPVLVYDCTALSDQLGVRIDGVLGFPFFRQTLLTLDYPNRRVILQPSSASPPPGGSTIAFTPLERSPVIPVRLGDSSFNARLDSGLDQPLSLNPAGLFVRYAYGPIEGPTVTTLTGNHNELVCRLASDLVIGDYAVPRPVAEVVDDLSAIGGGIMKYFTLTFDQERGEVTFQREATDPIAIPGLRSAGLSFAKAPAYWRVVGVVPGSPADRAGVQPGDLVTDIDDEPVWQWDVRRYERLLANAEDVTYTFLNGTHKADRRLRVLELVP